MDEDGAAVKMERRRKKMEGSLIRKMEKGRGIQTVRMDRKMIGQL